jgi:chemotaxis family two-component system response regulator Rcp1
MSKGVDTTLRIVIVEDNPADIVLLEKALKSRNLNYELEHYPDGERAIASLGQKNRSPPDLILIDLNLPRHDGFGVLTAVRGNPSLVGVPVGVLTSSEDPKDKHRIALLGAEQYIHKARMLDDYLRHVGEAIISMLR